MEDGLHPNGYIIEGENHFFRIRLTALVGSAGKRIPSCLRLGGGLPPISEVGAGCKKKSLNFSDFWWVGGPTWA